MVYAFEEELALLLSGLLTGAPMAIFNIASYVLSALAIYVISRRRGLRKPWLAWIPVVNVWLLGSLSDQYQYVVKRQNKSKRKILLGLNLALAALTVAVITMAAVLLVQIGFGEDPEDTLAMIFGILGCILPMAGCAIAYAVIRYMALYDVFRSLDPSNATLFLVMSILVGVTEPFFLFFSRDKDGGMPPRRQEPVYRSPVREPWQEESERDYL